MLGLFFHFLRHVFGPLIVWVLKRADAAGIDAHGKESLNFQLWMLIYDAVALILCIVLIGIPILLLLWVVNTVLVIVASIKASEGEFYRGEARRSFRPISPVTPTQLVTRPL